MIINNSSSSNTELDTTKLGNCFMERGYYFGNGKYGSSYPNTITFSNIIQPYLLYITSINSSFSNGNLGNFDYFGLLVFKDFYVKLFGVTVMSHMTGVNFSARQITWHHSTSSEYQLNYNNKMYNWVALGTK